MTECPQCQAGRKAGRKFCPGCGTPLAAPPAVRRCEACGIDYPAEKKFCASCGLPLGAFAPSAAKGPVPRAAEGPPPPAPKPPVPATTAATVTIPKPDTKPPAGQAPAGRPWVRLVLPVALVLLAAALFIFAISVFSVDGFTDLRDDEVGISWLMVLGGIGALVLARVVFVRGRPRRSRRGDDRL